MATKKVTKKALTEAYEELNDVVGVEPPIEVKSLKLEELEKELHETVEELVQEEDEFTKKTQSIFDYLAEKYGEAEDEDEEDEDEEDEEDEDEEDEDEEDEDEEDEEEEEDEEDEEEDDDEDEEDEDEEEEEDEEDEEDEEEDEEDEDEEEEEEPVKKKGKKKVVAKKPAKKVVAKKKVVTKKPAKKAPAKKAKAVKKTTAENVMELVAKTTDRKVLLGLVKANREECFKGLKTKAFGTGKKLQAAMVKQLKPQLPKAPAAAKASNKKGNPAGFTKVGIGAFIEKCLVDSGKKGISRALVLKKLVRKFPDRAESGMKKTVGVTIPLKLSKKYVIKKRENGRFYIAKTLKK